MFRENINNIIINVKFDVEVFISTSGGTCIEFNWGRRGLAMDGDLGRLSMIARDWNFYYIVKRFDY